MDELFEIEVSKKTLLETESHMQSNTSKFYEKLKGKVPKKTEQVQNPAEASKPKEHRDVEKFRGTL